MSDIAVCAECRGERIVRYRELFLPPVLVRAPTSYEAVHAAEKSRPCGRCSPVEFARWRENERRRIFTLIETGKLPRWANVENYLPR